MLAQTYSLAHLGAEPSRIIIETDVSAGLPGIAIVGLASKSVEESRERIRSAIRNSGLEFPPRKTVINLAPADLAKHGTGYELAIALGILTATKQIKPISADTCLVAELALDGTLRPAQEVIATVLSARKAGFTRLIVDNDHQAALHIPPGLEILRAQSLRDVYDWLVYDKELLPYVSTNNYSPSKQIADFADIRGLEVAKRALEIAAAGNHNLLLSGPPGSGKTLLAQALPGILPAMTSDEYASSLYLQSLARLPIQPILAERPFRAPHHTASNVALVGGGQQPKPGEISLAHNGVLFLDELPEFSRSVLESLRQPLEDGLVHISRSQHSIVYPANFMLIAAMNPCPCGFAESQTINCVCSPSARERYRRRLSGPLLDRFDLQCSIREPSRDNPFHQLRTTESSADVRKRVYQARSIQARRYKDEDYTTNSRIPSSQLTDVCQPNEDARALIDMTLENHYVSQRGLSRALKVARTLADLEGAQKIERHHLAEALQFRQDLQPDSSAMSQSTISA